MYERVLAFMGGVPELIVMLTRDDHTVENAYEIFTQCRNTGVQFWGMKEKGLPLKQMKELYAYMKDCGKTTVLEVAAYTDKECIEGAQIAVECKCDFLMGTMFMQSVNELCKENNLKYMPFIGNIEGRPSILSGSIEGMIEEAENCLEQGVYGFDLLGYRYRADAVALNNRFVSQVRAPVCIAGSIDSPQKLAEVKHASPWAFTIGSAFFANAFGGTIGEQIEKVRRLVANA